MKGIHEECQILIFSQEHLLIYCPNNLMWIDFLLCWDIPLSSLDDQHGASLHSNNLNNSHIRLTANTFPPF